MDYLFEAKNIVNKLKNVVLNLSEIETKVEEATNNDPWGASSTLMKEISAASNNFQQFNEITTLILKKIKETESYGWRQIYKSLTLLEYLIKNGNERMIDLARQNISLLKALKNYKHTDSKGRDQGLNVRTRAEEIIELLSNSKNLKEQRNKALANRNKYTGVGSQGQTFSSSFSNFHSNNDTSSHPKNFLNFQESNSFNERSAFDDDLEEVEEITNSRKIAKSPIQQKPKKELDLMDFVPTETKNSIPIKEKIETEDFDEDFGEFESASKPNNSENNKIHKPLNSNINDLLGQDLNFQYSNKKESKNNFIISQAKVDYKKTSTEIKEIKPNLELKPNSIWSENLEFLSLDFTNKERDSTSVNNEDKNNKAQNNKKDNHDVFGDLLN